jgi:hypothetical protein
METVQINCVPVLQTVINVVPVQVTIELISSVIGVPVELILLGVPHPDSMEPPSMDKFVQFFDPRQAQEDAP